MSVVNSGKVKALEQFEAVDAFVLVVLKWAPSSDKTRRNDFKLCTFVRTISPLELQRSHSFDQQTLRRELHSNGRLRDLFRVLSHPQGSGPAPRLRSGRRTWQDEHSTQSRAISSSTKAAMSTTIILLYERTARQLRRW